MSNDQSLGNSRGAGAVTLQHIGTRDGHLAGSRLMLLLSALVGGALTWFLLQNSYPMFDIPEELLERTKGARETLPPELQAAFKEAYQRVDSNHAIVVSGILRALLASLLAVGEGIARRSLRTAVSGAVLGILVGGILGGLAGLAGFLLDNYLESFPGLSKLARTLCVQGVLLGGLGAAVGLAFGALTRRTSATLTCLAYGLLGGGLAALIWPVCAALVLPTMDPDCTIPSQGSVRLLWIAVVSVAFGLLIPEALRPRVPRRAPNASADA